MIQITFITGNKAKAGQLARHLGAEIRHQKIDLEEIQSLDLDKVVTQKAKDAFKIVNTPVLVEDVSLTFGALGKLPGPLIKWFLEELGCAGLCELVNKYDDRSCAARVAFCLYDGKENKIFDAEVQGRLATKPRGDMGFGWDPVFIPRGYEKTWAEMNEPDQGSSGMRKVALKKLKTYSKNKESHE